MGSGKSKYVLVKEFIVHRINNMTKKNNDQKNILLNCVNMNISPVCSLKDVAQNMYDTFRRISIASA